jgi:hypothetical protein
MKKLKCEDYFIIKIRYYASEYYLNKFHNNDVAGLIKQREAAENHTKFFWDFIEKIAGKQNYYEKYYYNIKECVLEEIHETYGIIIIEGEVYYKYFIPKNNKNSQLIDWMVENIKNPFAVLRKTNVGFRDTTPSNFYRKMSLEAKNKK